VPLSRLENRLAGGTLTVEIGRMKGQSFPLGGKSVLSIGRSVQCDIQIPDQGVSRAHCRVEKKDGGYYVSDLGSSNGTLLNGAMVRTAELKAGDRITLGASTLRFGLEGVPPAGKREKSNSTILLVKEEENRNTVRRRYDKSTATVCLGEDASPALALARERLNALCEFTQTVYADPNVQAIYAAAADAAMAVTSCERVAIMLCDQATGEPAAVVSKTLDPVDAGKEFRVSTTILQEALSGGVSVLSSDAKNDERFKSGVSVMMQRINSVMCVPLRAKDRTVGAIYVDSRSSATKFTEAELSLLAAIGQQAGLALERARLVNDLENLFLGAVRTLIATIEAKDAYTRGHGERVTAYALMIADEMGLDEDRRSVLELGGILHDVGKIGVPEAVLLKAGKLDDEEFAQIRKHPDAGVRIIENMPELDRLVSMSAIVNAVRHHHERFDGNGYPGKLAGENIPLSARIIAVADTFDAITSCRPYRNARKPEEAAEIIRECSGSQLDPEATAAFLRVFDRGETETSVTSVFQLASAQGGAD
jgi:HD-GYP domain-containing protein (c-di-GMP phosphodiesterase class II)/pSer/pThr/pTyr-binding forkhead associated (FHA) protein